MKLLLIDFETTGLNPEVDEIVEVAVALYDTDTNNILRCSSTLVRSSKPLPAESVALTGITNADLLNGCPREQMVEQLHQWGGEADALVAHNVSFERGFIARMGNAGGLFEHSLMGLPTLDTMTDIPYPATLKNRSLDSVAMYHRYYPQTPHRALSDVLTMAYVLAQYDWKEVEAYWRTPVVTLVEADRGYCEARNSLVKEQGLKWDATAKVWSLSTRDSVAY